MLLLCKKLTVMKIVKEMIQRYIVKLIMKLHSSIHFSMGMAIDKFFSFFLFFKLWKYDNSLTGDLENTEQGYIHMLLLLLLLSCSVVSDSVRPHRRQPTRLPRPWDSPGNNSGVGCHFLLQCMKVKSESEVTQSCPTLSDPMDYSLPGSSVHGFSRQEYWSGVPLPSPTYTC